jgi:hypothetical protein
MMINIGVGVKRSTDPGKAGEEAQTGDDGTGDILPHDQPQLDGVESDHNSTEVHDASQSQRQQLSGPELDDQQEPSDASVLSTIVEEMYQRFSDTDVANILKICEDVLSGAEENGDEMEVG